MIQVLHRLQVGGGGDIIGPLCLVPACFPDGQNHQIDAQSHTLATDRGRRLMGFVVKNGSNTCIRVSSSIPMPVSVTKISTYVPTRASV